eukprot:TRINITY_DN1053_c0_g1_i1.p1 TRINITY_DN1053_c0_g1~~TRINITY_DN1053_c0_g1_i1.p1  ORF type:complete len:1221 (-),score=284.31 TRINITY_DN1053_c0_g1_i1:254-3850(-)
MRIATLLFFLSFASVSCAVDWSTLTAAQLRSLSTSEFQTITAAELNSIPVAACSGFQYTQISAIPPDAFPGWTREQIEQLGQAVCTQFQAGSLSQMTANAISGIQPGCIQQLPGDALSNLNSSQIAAISTAAVAVISNLQIQSVTTGAAGFTAGQIAVLQSTYGTACAGIPAGMMGALTPDAFSGFTPECIGRIASESFNFVVANQTARLGTACSGFTPYNIGGIPTSAAAGLSVSCVSSFTTGSSGACTGISTTIMAGLTPASYAGFTAGCISKIPTEAFSLSTASQFSYLNVACSGFDRYTIVAILADAASGITKECVSNFTNGIYSSACAGMTNVIMANLPAASYAGFPAECIQQIASDSFSASTQAQFSKLNPAACSGFTRTNMNGISSDAASGITKECVANFSYGLYASGCNSITSATMANLPDASYAGFQAGCIQQIESTSFVASTRAQFSNLTPAACSGFTRTNINGISSDAASGITKECVANFSYGLYASGCNSITSATMANLPDASYAGFQAGCIQQIESTSFVASTRAQFSNLTPAACSGFTRTNINGISSDAASGITKECVANFSYGLYASGCNSITSATMANLPDASYAGFQAGCIQQIASASFSDMQKSQAENLTPNGCSGFTRDNMAGISQAGAQGLTAGCVANFSYGLYASGCNSISSEIIAGIPAASYAGFTAGCLMQISADALSALNPDQVGKLTPVACSGFTRDNMLEIPQTAAAGFTQSCVGNFSYELYASGCNSIGINILMGMTPSAYAGFSSGCIAASISSAWANVSSSQISNIPVQSVSGLTRDIMSVITKNASSGFSAEQVSKFGYPQFRSGCRGISSDVFSGLSTSAWAGWTPGCIYVVKDEAMASLTPSLIALLSVTASSGISPSGFRSLRNDTLTAMSIPQLTALKNATVSGMEDYQIKLLIGKYGCEQIGTLWGLNAWSTVYPSTAYQFKQSIPGTITPCLDVTKFTASVLTWLELALSADKISFTDAQIQSMSEVTFYGFRRAQIASNSLTPDNIRVVSQIQLQHLLPDAISAFSADQLNALASLNWIPRDYQQNISVAQIPQVSLALIGGLTSGTLSSWSCPQVLALTSAQAGAMTVSTSDTYKWRVGFCTSTATTTYTNTNTPTYSPPTSDGPSGSNTQGEVSSPKPGLSPGAIAGIVLGGLIGVGVLAIGGFFAYRFFNKRSGYNRV